MTTPNDQLTIFGEADAKTKQQALECLAAEEGAIGVLCGDNHLGYGQPVGMAVAYREHISPKGVGYDIGCGNKAVGTGIYLHELPSGQISGWMDSIFREIDFGIGRSQSANAEHPVLDEIRETHPEHYDKAVNQLGSVGGGNHYVDLFAAEDGEIVVGVHFGSRGFGHTIATQYFDERDGIRLLKVGTEEADTYIGDMELAGRYAYAGRDVCVDRVLQILGSGSPVWEVHNHHNFAWRERHFGEDFWVIRKGCTPAFPSQRGFVGATMGEYSVLLEGTPADPEAGPSPLQERALFSTVHGAGRAMSRTKAAGKVKRRWTCNTRDCDWQQGQGEHKPTACPKCGNAKMTRRKVTVLEGAVDWKAELDELSALGIELRGGAADEAPLAYKRLPEVLAAQKDTISVLQTLQPLGVAMAPAGVRADD